MASMYFVLNEDEKALAIIDKVAQNSLEYLRFAASLSKAQRKALDSTTGRESAILGYVLQTCERYKHTELVDKYYEDYAKYAK